jgi:predicted metalloprotease with PDZ domain
VCTSEKLPPLPTLDYVVRVDDLGSRRLQVTLRTSGIEGDSLLLHGVPVYMDNPTAAAVDSAVRDLRATDKSGKRRLRIAPAATDDGHPAWWITGGKNAVVSYTLVVDFKNSPQTERYSILIPYMKPDQAWLYGNTVFCFPQLAGDVRATASEVARITVVFDHPGVPVVALRDTTELHNVYELMSLQFGLGRFVTEGGTANGVQFEIVYKDSTEFTPRERALLFERTGEMMVAETQYFGGAPFERLSFLYFRAKSGGGLEGSNACQIYAAEGLDLADFTNAKARRFYAVAVHELFHTWNPVYMTATEDPWIKEGVSSYADRVLAARLGYQTPEDIADGWHKYYEQFDSNATMRSVALTDSRLWAREYDGEEWRLITYERGMVTALLLDVHIREATNNQKSLDDVLAGLYARYVHRGYNHAQLIETIEAVTGVDVSDFFAHYVDGANAPSKEEVSAAFERAVQLGVFD